MDSLTEFAKVEAFSHEVLLIMQDLWLLPITDLDVFNETVYTEKQKLLVAYYTAFNILTEKSIKTVGGVAGEVSTDQRIITQEQAGAVSVSYKALGKNEGFGTDIEMMLRTFREKACTFAYSMGISLPICQFDSKQVDFIPVYFKPD